MSAPSIHTDFPNTDTTTVVYGVWTVNRHWSGEEKYRPQSLTSGWEDREEAEKVADSRRNDAWDAKVVSITRKVTIEYVVL